MVSRIDDSGNVNFQPQIQQNQESNSSAGESLNSCDKEDEAIISAQAKLLNELDKFNSGKGDITSLAVASAVAQSTVETNISIINAKNSVAEKITEIGE